MAADDVVHRFPRTATAGAVLKRIQAPRPVGWRRLQFCLYSVGPFGSELLLSVMTRTELEDLEAAVHDELHHRPT